MGKTNFKNSLTNTPIIGKPKLGLRKRVFDAEGNVIGSVSGNRIYDLNGRVWGSVVTKDTASGYNKNDIVSHGNVIGTIDNHHNIYSKRRSATSLDVLPSVFTGTIKANKVAALLLPLIIGLAAATAVSSVVVAGVLQPDKDYLNYAPILSVLGPNQKAWAQDEDLKIFKSNTYNTDAYIAPGDRGDYVFVIKNDNKHAITYAINFKETNEDEENKFGLRYRLSCESFYVLGQNGYVTLDEKTTPEMRLEAGQSRLYRLYWYWDETISDAADNVNGLNQNTYNLGITITA